MTKAPYTPEDLAFINEAKERISKYFIGRKALTTPRIAADYFTLYYSQHEREVFVVAYLNAQHEIIEHEELFHGTIDGSAVYPREIAKAALLKNASAVMLVHNHPSGKVDPSSADRQITGRINDALRLFDIRVIDHLIVGAGKHYSFAEAGLL
jgi:DNA repair protein RadC